MKKAKNGKVLIIITVALLLLLVGAFVSCKESDTDAAVPSTTTAAPATTTAPAADPEPEPEPEPAPTELVFNAELLNKYKIVTVFNADTDAVDSLIDGIKEKTGVELKSEVDTAAGCEVTANEILIGKTNRKESVAAKNSLSYSVALKGEKLVITYGSDAMLEAAIEHTLSLFVDGAATLPLEYSYEKEYEMKIDGVGIGQYKLVYAAGDDDGKAAAEFLADEINKAVGVTVDVITDETAAGEYEIIMGTTSRGEAETCDEYYSYKVRVAGKSFKLSGYDGYALNNAAYGLLNAIIDANGDGKTESLELTYTLPDREEYIADIEKLYMRWIAEWQPPEGMLDFNVKCSAFETVSDRLLTSAHRADAAYYPENSIESIISFYLMGGDAVEIDVNVTKDGKLVLIHDDTLSRVTDWAEKNGKNGLPTSNYVKNWTYEQLMQLNLKEGKGGDDAKVTPFKIATLTEALIVCKNKMFIFPDKAARWRYADVSIAQVGNPNNFLFEAMVEAENYNSIVLSYGYLSAIEAIMIQKYIYERTSVVAYMMIRDKYDTPSNTYDILSKKAMPNSFAIQINGSYDIDTFPDKYSKDYAYLKDKCVMLSWTIKDGNYPNAVDTQESWDIMYYDIGYRMIMTNSYMDLVKYAAAIYEKTNGN